MFESMAQMFIAMDPVTVTGWRAWRVTGASGDRHRMPGPARNGRIWRVSIDQQ